MPSSVIEEALHQTKDRPFDEEGSGELRVLDLAMLGVGRLLVVHQAPELLEDLLAELTGKQAADDAERE